MRRERSTRSNIVRAMPILTGVGDACESRWFGGRKSCTVQGKVLAYYIRELINVDGSNFAGEYRYSSSGTYILELRLKVDK